MTLYSVLQFSAGHWVVLSINETTCPSMARVSCAQTADFFRNLFIPSCRPWTWVCCNKHRKNIHKSFPQGPEFGGVPQFVQIQNTDYISKTPHSFLANCSIYIPLDRPGRDLPTFTFSWTGRGRFGKFSSELSKSIQQNDW